MASNQGKRSLDQSTRNTLSALEKALEMSIESPLRDDEFTSEQYIEKMKELGHYHSDDACRMILKRLAQSGQFKVRKIKMHGKQCNAYSSK
jgi:hypothetical protein